MKTTTILKFTASAALLGTVAIGCKPSGEHPATLSAKAPSAARGADKMAAKASQALAKHNPAKAVGFAEAAVRLAPIDAGFRTLLGQSYIQAGRFVSAEVAFRDALTLAPNDGRALFSLALCEIALGKWDEARARLGAAGGRIAETDRGLALALAGDTAGAVPILEAAARSESADAKTRQNLALGYALAGRWGEAHATAERDLPLQIVTTRLAEWARFAKPKNAWDQVSALLGVTPVEDAGMPASLALAMTPGTPAPASAAPVAASVAPAPDRLIQVAEVPASQDAPVDSAPVETAQAEPVYVPPHDIDMTVHPDPMFDRAPAPAFVERAATTPPRFIGVAKRASFIEQRADVAQSDRGHYVVQIGAFAKQANVDKAWREQAGKVGQIANYLPSRSTFGAERIGTVYRLSLAGFQSREAAAAVCERVRSVQGECWVREAAGDQPIEWVQRERRTQVASN